MHVHIHVHNTHHCFVFFLCVSRLAKVRKLDDAFLQQLGAPSKTPGFPAVFCGACKHCNKGRLVLKRARSGMFMVVCQNDKPVCKGIIMTYSNVLHVQVDTQLCQTCGMQSVILFLLVLASFFVPWFHHLSCCLLLTQGTPSPVFFFLQLAVPFACHH